MKYLMEHRKKLQEAINDANAKGQIKFDLNGHYRGKINEATRNIEIMGLSTSCVLEDEEFNNLLEATKSGKATKMIKIGLSGLLIDCFDCGVRTCWEFDGVTLRIVDECKYKDGIPCFVFELNVPSGTMVVANDLRDGFKVIGNYDVNNVVGMEKTTMKYAKVGMAHCFVGNTCPRMFKIGKQKIGSNFRIGQGRGNGVAGICTDLWWYSIVDLDSWVKTYERQPTQEDLRNMCLVKCRPGVYKFTHQYHCIDPDKSNATYSTVEWVRESDPVVDYRAKYLEADFTAEQIVHNLMKLNGEDKGYARRYKEHFGDATKCVELFRAIDQIFCVNGSGMEIHPNGWLGCDPDMTTDAPSVNIPLLEGRYKWYPVSEYSFLAHCSGIGNAYVRHHGENRYLNDSFLELAFNICQNIIRYGSDVYDSKQTEVVKNRQEKEIVDLIKKCCLGLAERNPNRLPKFILPVLKSLK